MLVYLGLEPDIFLLFAIIFQIGRLPMEWAKCVVPLVNSGKVKLNGRCIAAPPVLSMMQDIMLYVR